MTESIVTISGWTDYPIVELGDIPGEVAPIREAIATSFDGDKYIEATVGGVHTSFKAGYFYRNYGRAGEAETFTWELETLPRTKYD